MGIHTWTLNNILTPKFWKLVQRDGFLHTYIRPFKNIRDDQYAGGHEGPVKCVGQDDLGNRYFEDFAVDRSLIRPSQQKMGGGRQLEALPWSDR